MPFIPHTAAETEQMLRGIGVSSIDALFDEIPAALHCGELPAIPEALSEQQVTRLMEARAERDGHFLSFLGAGAYEHFIPAAIWQIVTRGEFYTAYTPYQAEASQGTLQLLYEFQSMMSSLTGLDVSNASLYDGASALAEAVLMSVRAHPARGHRVVVPRTVHPLYRQVLRSVVAQQGIELVELPYVAEEGRSDASALAQLAEGAAAVVIPQPNFFGVLEEVDALIDIAHDAGALALAVCNPLALGLLHPPGEWGKTGADICCGEAQPLGLPLSGGGPYLGYLTSRSALVRQMPGRIVGRTVDLNGRPGFTLTLQAREQHIRRAKATSNICTNQGLMVVAATLYMALLGAQGLSNVARACHHNARRLRERLVRLPGVKPMFAAPFFHEFALRMPCDTGPLLADLRSEGMLAGLELTGHYPEFDRGLLVCATETKTDEDLDRLAEALARRLK